APRTRPFLLWLHYLDPHHPYDPPPPYDTMFSTKPDEHAAFVDELAAMPTREQTRRLVRIGSGEESVSEGEFQAIIDRYDGEIAFTDMQIGRVLDRIEARGLARDTMIVVTADHGEEFRDHQAWGHSHTLHRELLHVPLMIKYPGGVSSPRERLRMRVRLLDIAPTIAEAIGLPSPKAMKGEPLQNAGPHDRTAVSLLTRKKRLSIEKEGWKLITAGDDGDAELYDLSQDPHEHEDLIAAEPEIAAGLVHDLEALVGRNAMAEDIRETAARLDSSTRRQLEALGYVD
ncbi:MAG TPA: sulfatase-like hydrolase/transferase, partial [Gammaproteobacteria bacterium]